MASILPDSILQFGDFQLDCGRFELLRKGQFVRVERKPMELLVLLVAREGAIVTRAEIAERLWSSEVFVDTEHGINTAVGKLRHVLRDDADRPRFIQTVTGRGYRFVAPVLRPAPVAEPPKTDGPVGLAAAAAPSPLKVLRWYIGAACLLIAIGGVLLYRLLHQPAEVRFTQLTELTDSAVAPAVSPDGHMVAFIRGDNGFPRMRST